MSEVLYLHQTFADLCELKSKPIYLDFLNSYFNKKIAKILGLTFKMSETNKNYRTSYIEAGRDFKMF